MEVDPFQTDIDLTTQSLLLAAANHDISSLRNLLKSAPANVQDPETGYTPLHAAVAACEEESQDIDLREEKTTNGHETGETRAKEDVSAERRQELDAAAEVVRELLQSGAIWNDLDANNETPGCIAKRLGLEEIYQAIVDAGVRAELLMSRLDEYQELGDEDSDDDEDMEAEVQSQTAEQNESNAQEEAAITKAPIPEAYISDPSANNDTYLADQITITNNTILDSAANGVMMDWETPIMERHASLLLPRPGLRVLNIGHGMGIIDALFQSHSPVSHHIVEAHPDVLKKMREDGWYEKPGVVVHEGKWQDVLPNLVGADGEDVVFDAIYFDTFAEDYKALREFFSEFVVQFLDSEGRMSFFNGMGADRQVCYDVYTKVS